MSRRGRDAMQVAGQVPDNRWAGVAAYCAVSSANQMLWLTFAPITTVAARHYGVAVSSMGWMANVFPRPATPRRACCARLCSSRRPGASPSRCGRG
jgi:hypothetical protein